MSIVRGDTNRFVIRCYEVDPATGEATTNPYKLTSCTAWCTLKRSPHEADTSALYQHSITIDAAGTVTASDGLSLQGTAAAGVLIDEITAAESSGSRFRAGTYYWDVQVLDGNGRVTTVASGTDTIEDTPDITRAITTA